MVAEPWASDLQPEWQAVRETPAGSESAGWPVMFCSEVLYTSAGRGPT